MTKSCTKCANIFKVKASRFETTKFCSKVCYWEALRGVPKSSAFKSNLKIVTSKERNPFYGKTHTQETRQTLREAALGKIRHTTPHSIETKQRLSITSSANAHKGKDHWNWKGGISLGYRSQRKDEMRKLPYKNWRTQVFNKDNYTCVDCGQHGGKLEADHIKQWALYPELRFDVTNGDTVCISCHRKRTSTFMLGNKYALKNTLYVR